MSAAVAHVVEIRLAGSEDWSICDISTHPLSDISLGVVVADVANRLCARTKEQGDTCKTQTTRDLSGNLKAAVVHVEHDEGSSFFRHTIQRTHPAGVDPWLGVNA